MQRVRERYRLEAVGRFTDELEAIRAAEHGPRGEAKRRLVVDDYDG